jgi:hypothetical protein
MKYDYGVFNQVPILSYAHVMMDIPSGCGHRHVMAEFRITKYLRSHRRFCASVANWMALRDGLVSNYVECNHRLESALHPYAFVAIR